MTLAGAGAAEAAESGAADAAVQAGEPTVFDGPVRAGNFTVNSTVNAAFLKTTSTTAHAVTIYQAGTSGTGAAMNVISDNPETSAIHLSGKELRHGTLKITHIGQADGSDDYASALSIDLVTRGTASKGIYIYASQGPTSGNMITARNNDGLDDFVVRGSGRVGVGVDRGADPWAQLHVVQRDATRAGLMVEGTVRITDAAVPPGNIDSMGGGALYVQDGTLM